MKNQRLILLVSIVFVLFYLSCGSEGPDSENVLCIISTIKTELENKSISNNYIVNVSEELEFHTLIFDDGSQLEICNEIISQYEYDYSLWQIEFTFSDATAYLADSKGRISISANLDPFGRNPLSALAAIKANRRGKVQINIKGKNGPDSDLIHAFDDIDTSFELPIFGLYQDYENQIEITFLSQNDQVIDADTLILQTPIITSIDPTIEILKADRSKMEPGEFHLVSSLSYWGPNIVYMFDTYGEIRWMINYKDSEILNNLFYDVGVEKLQNGNLYFGDKMSLAIYEVDFFGNIVDSWPMPGYRFHHHVQEKPNGNFLVTVLRSESVHNNGKPSKHDFIIEIDRITKEIIKEWDLKQLLDEDRNALGEWTNDTPVDWIHTNAVTYSASDNTIIISGRHQGIAKIDYDDNVRWIMAPQKGWGDNRKGQDCTEFLLSATNQNDEPYNQEVQLGNVNDLDFEWPWFQHAPELLPNGNLLVFDNGAERNFGNSGELYSRAVEYSINEETKTVQQIWQYGKERGSETFAEVLSDVDYLPVTGNILFCPGFGVFNGVDNEGGRIIEVDYDTKEIYFEAFIGSDGLTFHRVERMSFY